MVDRGQGYNAARYYGSGARLVPCLAVRRTEEGGGTTAVTSAGEQPVNLVAGTFEGPHRMYFTYVCTTYVDLCTPYCTYRCT